MCVSVQNASDITAVLLSGSVNGVVNSMAAYGVAVDEDELMRELDEMLCPSDGGEQQQTEPSSRDEKDNSTSAMDLGSSAASSSYPPAATKPSIADKTREEYQASASAAARAKQPVSRGREEPEPAVF